MNANQIINMILRRFMRQGINKGINAGLNRMGGPDKAPSDMTPEERRRMKEGRKTAQQTKKRMRTLRRFF